MSDQINVTENLKKLSDIATWFEDQEQVDVEEGLEKVKEAAVLIQESKKRLQDIQNEFIEVKKQIEDETDINSSDSINVVVETIVEETSSKDTPF